MREYDQPIQRLTHAQTSWRDADYLSKRVMIADLLEARRFARGRLLDVGCGNKPYLEMFAAHVRDYIGLDPDHQHSRPDVVADVSCLPFPDASFDTVLTTQVIEHVPEPSRMMAEISRILAPGGHLILTAPQYWRLHEIPHDYYRFTKYGLQHLIETSGLTPALIKEEGAAWTVIGQAVCHALQDRRVVRRLIPLINLIFAWVDRVWPDAGDVLNYLVVARK
jgi:SAM-dependent methyltransferase